MKDKDAFHNITALVQTESVSSPNFYVEPLVPSAVVLSDGPGEVIRVRSGRRVGPAMDWYHYEKKRLSFLRHVWTSKRAEAPSLEKSLHPKLHLQHL